MKSRVAWARHHGISQRARKASGPELHRTRVEYSPVIPTARAFSLFHSLAAYKVSLSRPLEIVPLISPCAAKSVCIISLALIHGIGAGAYFEYALSLPLESTAVVM